MQDFFDFLCACGKNTFQPCLIPHLVLDFVISILFYLLHSDLYVYFQLMYHLTLEMTILAIMPGNQNISNFKGVSESRKLLWALHTPLPLTV